MSEEKTKLQISNEFYNHGYNQALEDLEFEFRNDIGRIWSHRVFEVIRNLREREEELKSEGEE